MLNITKGKIHRAQKVVIYGPEGIGKSSLAARFPDPVIIDTEGGTAHMDVRRIDKPQSWEELLAIVKEVAATPGICKTLVIDTADWAEQLITTYLCNKYKQNSIESFGYGKGCAARAPRFSAQPPSKAGNCFSRAARPAPISLSRSAKAARSPLPYGR